MREITLISLISHSSFGCFESKPYEQKRLPKSLVLPPYLAMSPSHPENLTKEKQMQVVEKAATAAARALRWGSSLCSLLHLGRVRPFHQGSQALEGRLQLPCLFGDERRLWGAARGGIYRGGRTSTRTHPGPAATF